MLYTSDCKIIDFSDYTYLDAGMCAAIYKKDLEVLKFYKTDCKYYRIIPKNVFLNLKSLSLSNIVKLHDYYYDNSNKFSRMFPIDAYTMEYVPKDNINILEDKDYFLDTINSLEKVGLELTKNKIMMYDSHHTNIIFNKKGATIIDVDSFRKTKLLSYKSLLLNNKKEIFNYVKSTIVNCYYNTEYYSDIIMLLNIDIKNKSVTDSFKELMVSETPELSFKKLLLKK